MSYAVDREVVRIVVAGSSAELFFAFQQTTAKGNRWSIYELADPVPSVVEDALVQLGYSRDEAHAMVALCGTRLRLLRFPLVKGPATCAANAFLSKSLSAGRSSIYELLSSLGADTEGEAKLVDVLNAVAEADQSPSSRRPSKDDLPDGLRNVGVSSAIYVTTERKLFFQSELAARAWASMRHEYSSAARARPPT